MKEPPDPITTFLVELYQERHSEPQLAQTAARARACAAELTNEGRPTRHVRLVFVPEDENCFHVFTSTTAVDVAEACRRAGIAYERIVEARGTPSDLTHTKEAT